MQTSRAGSCGAQPSYLYGVETAGAASLLLTRSATWAQIFVLLPYWKINTAWDIE